METVCGHFKDAVSRLGASQLVVLCSLRHTVRIGISKEPDILTA